LSGVLGDGAPLLPPPIVVLIDRSSIGAPLPQMGPGFPAPGAFGSASTFTFTSTSAATPGRPWDRADFWGSQEGRGEWGVVVHREFARNFPGFANPAATGPLLNGSPTGPLLIASATAAKGPPGGPADSLSIGAPNFGPLGGATASASMGGWGRFNVSYGGMIERKADDPPPPPSPRRDLPRGPFLPGSMLELQLAQDQALRNLAANSDAATPASNPVATSESGSRAASPPLQTSPEFSRQGPLSLSLTVDDQEAAQAFSIDDTMSSERAPANPKAAASDPTTEESEAAAPDVAASTDDESGQALLPRAAGLIASLLPHDQRSLETAVDQFLDELHDLGAGSLIEPSPIRALVVSASLIGAGVAVEAARRRLSPRRRRDRPARLWDAGDGEELLGFPELPGSWSARWL
jgi:hypothetical protein